MSQIRSLVGDARRNDEEIDGALLQFAGKLAHRLFNVSVRLRSSGLREGKTGQYRCEASFRHDSPLGPTHFVGQLTRLNNAASASQSLRCTD